MSQLKERFFHYLQSLGSSPVLKVIGIETAILSDIWIGIRAEVLLILILSTTDLITGVGVSIKYKKVSSWGLRQTVLKLSIYLLLLVLGGVIKELADINWADSAFVGLIVTTEMISILENIQLLCPGVLPTVVLKHFGIAINRKRKRK